MKLNLSLAAIRPARMPKKNVACSENEQQQHGIVHRLERSDAGPEKGRHRGFDYIPVHISIVKMKKPVSAHSPQREGPAPRHSCAILPRQKILSAPHGRLLQIRKYPAVTIRLRTARCTSCAVRSPAEAPQRTARPLRPERQRFRRSPNRKGARCTAAASPTPNDTHQTIPRSIPNFSAS